MRRKVFAQCTTCGYTNVWQRGTQWECLKCNKVWTPTALERRIHVLALRMEFVRPMPRSALGKARYVAVMAFVLVMVLVWVAAMIGHTALEGVLANLPLVLAAVAVGSISLAWLVQTARQVLRRTTGPELQRLLIMQKPYAYAPPEWRPPVYLLEGAEGTVKRGSGRRPASLTWRFAKWCWRRLGG